MLIDNLPESTMQDATPQQSLIAPAFKKVTIGDATAAGLPY